MMNRKQYHSLSKAEMDEAALRAELENELKNKKQCTYLPFECTQLSIDGYKYCSKHILQDKNAPYKQCSYIYSTNGKRCNLPAPRTDKKDYGYCGEHALKATLARNRQNSKHPLPCTAEVLLHSLSHYIKKPRIRSSSSSTQHSDDGDRASPDCEQKSAKFLDPFVDFDAASLYNDKCNQVLDVCSESESDVEASTFSSVWQEAQADSSDNESIDSDHEDVLKHANVYTAEEITLMTRDKLIRLQSLYIEQYRHLQYLLTKKRRTYLHSLKREKETCCNIYNQVRDNPKEQRLYKKLKSLNNYQKCHGVDAILSKRLKDLRAKITDGPGGKTSSYSKCIFTEGGVKCGERSLPLAKHCQKHILEDMNQVLFRACDKMTADVQCTTPIAAIFDDATCPLHLEVPPLRSYHQVRKDSESDAEETVERHVNYEPSPEMAEPIKTEYINYEIPPEIPKMESLPTMLFEENPQPLSSESTNTNCFMFGLPTTNLSEENEKLKLEAKKAEECAQNMMQLSRYVENQIQINDAEIKSETMDVKEEENDVTVTDEAQGTSADLDGDVEVSVGYTEMEIASEVTNEVQADEMRDSYQQIENTDIKTSSPPVPMDVLEPQNLPDLNLEMQATSADSKNEDIAVDTSQERQQPTEFMGDDKADVENFNPDINIIKDTPNAEIGPCGD